MDLKKRLAQLDRLSRRPAADPGPAGAHDPVAAADRELTLAELGLTLRPTPAGTLWCREYRDGALRPDTPLPDLREVFSRAADPGIGTGKILFLDTETTGLAGGTGTIPFLVGVSWWEDDELITRQYFLPEPGHETAMLADLAQLAGRFEVLVTFNGASFDLPLLRTRARLNRMDDPLANLVVWDLLVPSRRLWGNRLPDCRQQTLESEVCGLSRGGGDIEGSRIPQVWFDFLASGQAGLLPRVMTHNRRDMVGMACIFNRVVDAARIIDQGAEVTADLAWRDGWALGRICERRRDTAAALVCLEASVTRAPRRPGSGMGDPRFVADALRILKRGGDWPLIEDVINEGLNAGITDPWLHREAAILYEHRLVKLMRALDHAEQSGEDRRVHRIKSRLGHLSP